VSDYATVRAETHELLREISDGLRGLDAMEKEDALWPLTLVLRSLRQTASLISDVPRVPVKTHAEVEREKGGAP